jgi:hypothetical protein
MFFWGLQRPWQYLRDLKALAVLRNWTAIFKALGMYSPSHACMKAMDGVNTYHKCLRSEASGKVILALQSHACKVVQECMCELIALSLRHDDAACSPTHPWPSREEVSDIGKLWQVPLPLNASRCYIFVHSAR